MTPLQPADPTALLGAWRVVATTLPFWRGRLEPRITYTLLPDGRWRDEVTWRTAGGRARSILGVDTALSPGAFEWRGEGWLGWCRSRWCFYAVEDGFALTWFSAATLGVTPEGWDVYAREPVASEAIAAFRARVEARAGQACGRGWFDTAAAGSGAQGRGSKDRRDRL